MKKKNLLNAYEWVNLKNNKTIGLNLAQQQEYLMIFLNQAENKQQQVANNFIKKSYINLFFYKIKKAITKKLISKAGRNFLGRICVFHRGGANKRLYNQIDIYKRINEYGRIIKIYKQPNRSGLIGIILYYNGLVSLIILSEQVYIGSMLFNGAIIPPNYNYLKAQGWTIALKNLNLFSIISNIETIPFNGSKIARAAGVSGILSTYKQNKFMIKLNSGWQIEINKECLASIGKVSNSQHRHTRLNKAGVPRRLGIRPTVRGVAKNPCDHPHGGGEGKKSPPRAQVSPWGKLTKGTPTKNTKKERKLRRLYKQI